ncbi:MAG: 3-deoxy-manno-octulosonate cytidylyltransferase [Chitinophagales bacterium]|nr:3-deoxy-manno-octulosonate cytidylyltransferase [Chitinophagales bacterium]
MKILGIIPARYASTRFQGKPLTLIDGKPMIQHVYERCLQAQRLSQVLVATDDERIADAVKGFGGKYILTKSAHQSGTDRCAEACQDFQVDAVINIQGDEPKINHEQIDQVADMLIKGAEIATLAKEIDATTAQSPNIVKVVKDKRNMALYFSRSLIPYRSDVYFKHIGIYGYQKAILQKLTLLPVSFLEVKERLEQLRWLENAYEIHVGLTMYESVSIDTPDDLLKL